MTIYSSDEMLGFVPPSFKKQTNLVKSGIHVNVKMSHCANNVQSTEQFILPMDDSGKKDLRLFVSIFSEAQYFIANNNDKSNEFIAEKVSKKLNILYEDILAMLGKFTREDAGNWGGFAYLESYSVEIHSGDGKMLKFSN